MSFHPKMAYGATFHKSSRQLEDEGPAFVYTPENRARFDVIIQRYPPDQRRSAVLPALYLAQYQQGYITANAIRHVADVLGGLSPRFDLARVTSGYAALARAESALERNASPKIVADWLAFQL